MRLEPALTYRGALQILGQFDRPVFDRIERLASTAVLGGGLLDLVDPKNDGVRVLRGALDDVHSKLLGTSGYDRLQLIAAAHTTCVVASFFEALQAHLGKGYRDLELTDAEKLRLAAGHREQPRIEALSGAPVPIPGPRYGFRENLDVRLAPFYARLAADCAAFVRGLAVEVTFDQASVVSQALRVYEGTFVRLAADVPEFGLWVALGESAETHRELRELLSRVPRAGASSVDVLAALNREALRRPVLGDTTLDAVAELPTLEQAYVAPHLRVATAERGSHPTDERWWAEQRLVTSTELFLAGYLTSPESIGAPLLVLGLPGAGKSMLARMLAARVPESGWAAVRVPLRRVRADASVQQQIREALDELGHGRVSWPRLVEDAAAAGVTRVVLLDGLDELMQASGASQSRYLHEVVEFQTAEAAAGRPVAVVVTSRTVMADRVQIPTGTLVVRLEQFDDAQVTRWLAVWNGINAGRAGFRALPAVPESLASLGRQPLLLLLVALYTADPSAPPLAPPGVTTAALYEQLITHFLRREALKDAAVPAGRGLDVSRLVAERRRPLTLAAFAMVNRGRAYATGPELERDLGAFLGASPAREHALQEPLDHTIRTVGRFFFVHASGSSGSHELPTTYEFLHSTFGEYLVAEHLAAQLRFLRGQQREASALGLRVVPDTLRALLSHEPLVKFPRVLELAAELCDDAAPVLRELVAGARGQLGAWTPAAYNPSGRDVLDHYAIYTLNLVSLLAQIETRVAVASFAPSEASFAPSEAGPWWRALVRQWRASVDNEAWLAVVGSLTIRPGLMLERTSSRGHLGTRPADWLVRGEARLLGDERVDGLLSAGAAAWRGTIPDDSEAAGIFAGLVEMQLHGVISPRVLRAAVAWGVRLPQPAFDLLLQVATRLSEESPTLPVYLTGDEPPEALEPLVAAALALSEKRPNQS